MEWDSRLDEIFEEIETLLKPQAKSDPYPVLKKMRDLMKKVAEIVANDSAA